MFIEGLDQDRETEVSAGDVARLLEQRREVGAPK